MAAVTHDRQLWLLLSTILMTCDFSERQIRLIS